MERVLPFPYALNVFNANHSTCPSESDQIEHLVMRVDDVLNQANAYRHSSLGISTACHAALPDIPTSSFIRDVEGRGIFLLAMSDDVRVGRPVLSSSLWLSLSPLYGTTLQGVTHSSVHPALPPLAASHGEFWDV
jgi:hypothetical protein